MASHLTGSWRLNVGTAYGGNIVADLEDTEVIAWSDALYRQRMSALGKDDPSTIGCLPRGPRYITSGGGGGGLALDDPIVDSIRLISLEFKRDAAGNVTQAVVVGYGDEVVLTKQR
jgi:hypothetical protein